MYARAVKPHEFQWLVDRVGCHLTPDAKGILVEDSAGRIRACAVFDWWTANAAQAHLAVDEPIALRTLCAAAFPWFFDTIGYGVLLGFVQGANTRAIRLDKHLGFREVRRVVDGAAKGEDLVILEMRRQDCRWLPRKVV
jgi:hypothetical protein